MTSLTLKPKVHPVNSLSQAIITVDVDVSCSRILILDRISGLQIHAIKKPDSNFAQIRVPFKYSITNKLLVGIVDDTSEYNCEFKDGIRAEIIDGNTVLISN